MAADDLHPNRRRRPRRWALAALMVSLVACSSNDDDNANRCDSITESIVADAGGWQLLGIDELAEADTCVHVLDAGRLQLQFRDGEDATDTSTGWVGLNDLVTSAKAEGSAVVELGVAAVAGLG